MTKVERDLWLLKYWRAIFLGPSPERDKLIKELEEAKRLQEKIII